MQSFSERGREFESRRFTAVRLTKETENAIRFCEVVNENHTFQIGCRNVLSIEVTTVHTVAQIFVATYIRVRVRSRPRMPSTTWLSVKVV